jgi:hypothetical protein
MLVLLVRGRERRFGRGPRPRRLCRLPLRQKLSLSRGRRRAQTAPVRGLLLLLLLLALDRRRRVGRRINTPHQSRTAPAAPP